MSCRCVGGYGFPPDPCMSDLSDEITLVSQEVHSTDWMFFYYSYYAHVYEIFRVRRVPFYLTKLGGATEG